ncbi:hypothetical protein [Actinoplanes sp. NBRC 103695]|uniref:hypothetical protein n=1 Tax=Actinoplanes sp. NBRC 103695 TaxID=3032202 RepID=UPI0024A1EF0B|nr:hypothetical protein [Actinoplanes sp. NBRC 103695]GLY97228.1 hypothetical protein Acsp02_44820 [Actinoplanes sp. NBRC 103695]
MTKRIRIIVVAALVMVAGGWVGAFLAERTAWRYAPDLPSGAAAGRLTQTAFPGLRVYGGGNARIIERYGDGDGIRYGSAGYWVKHTAATQDVAAYSAGVRDRLTAAGWAVHDYRVTTPEPLDDGGNAYEATFWATRPGLVLAFSDHYWTGRPSYDSTGAAAFDLWRQPPSWMPAVAWGGAIGGALLALLLTMYVRRRAHPALRGLLAGGAVTAVVLLLPSTVAPGQETPLDSPWWGGFYYFGLLPAMLSAIIAGAMLLSAVAQEPFVRAGFRFLARRPRALAGVAVALLLAALAPWAVRQAGVMPCHPTGLPAEQPEATDSTHIKIFVSNTSTPQERALIDAAIFRSRAGSLGELVWEPGSAGFRDTYCGGGPVPASAVASLPYYFDVDLANPANYPALAEEVGGLAGVLAVRRAASS